MNLTRDRLASIGWVSILAFVAALTGALMLRVNAVKSEVQLAERRIVELRHEREFLETEYETRANQQQLSDLNELDFGYKAPAAGQYLESERQLAAFGKAPAPDAPAPIMMASADMTDGAGGSVTMVSPITGTLLGSAVAAEPDAESDGSADKPVSAASLSDRLGHVRHHQATDSTGDSRE